jgi:predicted transcriptional regulator
MDKQIDLEALRSRLAQMSRVEVLALADKAGLKRSTVEKFRLRHIDEPRLSKLEAIRDALAKADKSSARKAAAAPSASSDRRISKSDRRKGERRVEQRRNGDKPVGNNRPKGE